MQDAGTVPVLADPFSRPAGMQCLVAESRSRYMVIPSTRGGGEKDDSGVPVAGLMPDFFGRKEVTLTDRIETHLRSLPKKVPVV